MSSDKKSKSVKASLWGRLTGNQIVFRNQRYNWTGDTEIDRSGLANIRRKAQHYQRAGYQTHIEKKQHKALGGGYVLIYSLYVRKPKS